MAKRPSATHSRTGSLLGGQPFDALAHRELGLLAHAVVSKRAFDDGLDSNDRRFRPYSTTPLWVSNRASPKPRGGRRTRVLNPKTGRMNYGGGVFYAGGYREYKRATLGTDKVNLTRTGNMRRKFKMKRAARGMVEVGLVGDASVYGTFVDRKRPWKRLSDGDRAKIAQALPGIVQRSLRRTLPAVGGP